MSWNDDGYRPSAKEGTAQKSVQANLDSKMDVMRYDGQTRVLAAAERRLKDGGIGVDLARSLGIKGLGTKRDAGAIVDALNGVAEVAMTKAETIVDQTEYTVWDALEL
jgi:hypothetical protein